MSINLQNNVFVKSGKKDLLSRCRRRQRANNANYQSSQVSKRLMDLATFKAFVVQKLKHICFPSSVMFYKQYIILVM